MKKKKNREKIFNRFFFYLNWHGRIASLQGIYQLYPLLSLLWCYELLDKKHSYDQRKEMEQTLQKKKNEV